MLRENWTVSFEIPKSQPVECFSKQWLFSPRTRNKCLDTDMEIKLCFVLIEDKKTFGLWFYVNHKWRLQLKMSRSRKKTRKLWCYGSGGNRDLKKNDRGGKVGQVVVEYKPSMCETLSLMSNNTWPHEHYSYRPGSSWALDKALSPHHHTLPPPKIKKKTKIEKK